MTRGFPRLFLPIVSFFQGAVLFELVSDIMLRALSFVGD
jgi:hypothetical protein